MGERSSDIDVKATALDLRLLTITRGSYRIPAAMLFELLKGKEVSSIFQMLASVKRSAVKGTHSLGSL